MFSTVLAVAVAVTYMYSRARGQRRAMRGGRQVGSKHRVRVRRSVESVHNEMGDIMFWCVYRMTYTDFQELHGILHEALIAVHKELMEEAAARRK